MGFFSGDNQNPEQDKANELLQEQMQQNQAELEEKRQNLMEQRIAIVRSEGGESWAPNYNQAYPTFKDKSPDARSYLENFFKPKTTVGQLASKVAPAAFKEPKE